MGDYAVACIGSAVTFAVILLLGCIKSDNRMLLIIRAHRSKQEPIKAQVYKLFRAKRRCVWKTRRRIRSN